MAIDAQSAATAERLRLAREELSTVSRLTEQGYERRPRLLELQSVVADYEGRLGKLAARHAMAEQEIVGARQERLNIESQRHSEVADQLQLMQTQAADLAQKLSAARDVLDRHMVRAPQDGVVTDIRFVTPGGVIPPGPRSSISCPGRTRCSPMPWSARAMSIACGPVSRRRCA